MYNKSMEYTHGKRYLRNLSLKMKDMYCESYWAGQQKGSHLEKSSVAAESIQSMAGRSELHGSVILCHSLKAEDNQTEI